MIIKSDHTDVLVMCLAATDTRGLFLKIGPNVYNIEEFQSKIEHSLIWDNLLVLHGLFGSDCTSAFFGHPSYNSLLMKWEHLAKKLAVFRDSNATLNEVHDAGLKLISSMYRCDVNLNLERARMFKERCNDKARKKKINIEWLPPTYAAQLHAIRAYIQVKDWGGNSLNPEYFGWYMVDDILEPIPMQQESATHFLIEVKKCRCKSDYLEMFWYHSIKA